MADKTIIPQVGDWVSFLSDCRIVIAEVRYLDNRRYDGVLTTLGAIPESAILEVRRNER